MGIQTILFLQEITLQRFIWFQRRHLRHGNLVSSKNFSKILPPNGWRPGPGKVGQGGLKVLHLW